MKPPHRRANPLDVLIALVMMVFGFAALVTGHEVSSGLLLTAIGYVALKVITGQ